MELKIRKWDEHRKSLSKLKTDVPGTAKIEDFFREYGMENVRSENGQLYNIDEEGRRSLILTSPDGTNFKLSVDNTGTLSATSI